MSCVLHWQLRSHGSSHGTHMEFDSTLNVKMHLASVQAWVSTQVSDPRCPPQYSCTSDSRLTIKIRIPMQAKATDRAL